MLNLVFFQLKLAAFCVILGGISYTFSEYEEIIKIYLRWIRLGAGMVFATFIIFYYVMLEISYLWGKRI